MDLQVIFRSTFTAIFTIKFKCFLSKWFPLFWQKVLLIFFFIVLSYLPFYYSHTVLTIAYRFRFWLRKRRAINPQQTRFNRASLLLLDRMSSVYQKSLRQHRVRRSGKVLMEFRPPLHPGFFPSGCPVALIRPLVATFSDSGQCLVPAPESLFLEALNASASFSVDCIGLKRKTLRLVSPARYSHPKGLKYHFFRCAAR